MKRFILYLFSFINIIYLKSENKVIFVSSPNFTDNSFALFKFLIEDENKTYSYTWLIDNTEDKGLYKYMMERNTTVSIEKLNDIKILDKKSITGMLAYIQAKYIFFTHGFYTGMGLPKSQIRMNLWHGMPLKSIGYLNAYGDDTTIPKSTFTIATSEIYQRIMSKVFDLRQNKVLLSGQPRCDLLTQTSHCLKELGIDKRSYQKIIFWAPTYRHSRNKKIKDGLFKSHLPILQEDELEKLNIYLKSIDTFMLVKLHPMDILNTYDFESFTNVKVIKDRVLLKNSCQLYSLLSEIDILLTDYSSIYIDFLLLDRPIVFTIDDFKEYKKTRNFVFKEPEKYMPGPIVNNIQSLITVLNDIIVNNHDNYVKERKDIKKKFHKYENSFSERLIKSLKL